MAKLTKRQKAIAAAIEANKVYTLEEAVQVLSSLPAAKFKESLDIAVNLGVDPRKSDQVVRGATTLPAGTGKTVRVAVFAQGAQAEAAKAAGADIVGFDDLAESIQGGDLNFDVVIAAPDAMRVVGKLGTILGPRGLMPNPKTGTVTFDVTKAIEEIKAGKVEYRADKAGIIHAPIGKVSFSAEKLVENFLAVFDVVQKAKPAAAKGTYMKSVNITTTMGPAIKIDAANVVVK